MPLLFEILSTLSLSLSFSLSFSLSLSFGKNTSKKKKKREGKFGWIRSIFLQKKIGGQNFIAISRVFPV